MRLEGRAGGEPASLARSAALRRPIALAGFMGVGKSSLGRLLAELLELPFHDTDACIEASTGRSIDSFFPAEEPEFRRLEAAAVADLLGRGPSVIALGGGALLDDASRGLLLERSLLIHLHVPWRELSPHLPALVATRPLLRGRPPAEIHRLYLARLAGYRQAPLQITIGRKGTAEAAGEVLDALRALAAPAGSERTAGYSRTSVRDR